MMVSGNDAANVIAENVGSTISQFMAMLNAYLQGIECRNTTFYNPHGLTFPNHLSSAYDLAIMMKRGLNIPKFRQLIGARTYLCPKTNKNKEFEIKQFFYMTKPESQYYYPHAIGGKT